MGSLAGHVSPLVDRLRKEVTRADRGTVAVGGITKAGNALERLLLEAVLVSHAMGERDLTDELRRRGASAGSGTYLRLLAERPSSGVSDPEDRRIVAAIAREGARGKRSTLHRMIAVRNANNHGQQSERDLVDATRVMRALLAWLESELVQQE